MIEGLQIKTKGNAGRYVHEKKNLGSERISDEAVEMLENAAERVYQDMPDGSKGLVTRVFYTPSRTTCRYLRETFVKSIPFSLALTAFILGAVYTYTYRTASIIADSNKDGVTSESEWRDAYRKMGIENFQEASYHPFLAVGENRAVIRAYKNGELEKSE